ncbi:MAG: hypothetical protein ACI4MH_06965 [Candidatus Coproplasma sp.]
MSILIAYKRGDTVYMGTDTRTTTDGVKRNLLCESGFKIQRTESGVLVGITGDSVTRQTVFAYPEIFTPDKKGKLTRKHISNKIIPRLKELLSKNGLTVEKEDELPSFRCGILLAYEGELFEICCNFAVYKYESFQAIGAVSSFGQFILANAKESDAVNGTIVKALDEIAKNSHLVGRPYLLIDTKEKEYKLIRGENQ